MFIKHVPLGDIKAQARSVTGLWRQVCEKSATGDWDDVAANAKRVRFALNRAGVIALVSALDVFLEAALSPQKPTAKEIDFLTLELDRLASGNIEPTATIYFPVITKMASRSGVKPPNQGDLFLPALPTEGLSLPASGEFGSALQGSKDFSQALHSAIDLYESQSTQESLRVVRQIIIALDNRKIGGPFGIACEFAAGWMDGAAYKGTVLSAGDIQTLRGLSSWLKQCGIGIEPAHPLVLSQLAWRSSMETAGRASIVNKRFNLEEISRERESEYSPVANIAAFGKKWHDTIAHWDGYVKNSGIATAQVFLNSLKELIEVLYPIPDLAAFAFDIGLMVKRIESDGFGRSDLARVRVASLLAMLQSAYETHDLAKISELSKSARSACKRMASTGIIEDVMASQEVPVTDFFEEIAKELQKPIEALAQGDLGQAAIGLSSLQQYLILVAHTEAGKKFGQACNQIAAFMVSTPEGPHKVILEILHQAALMVGQSELDAISLIDDALSMQKRASVSELNSEKLWDCPTEEDIEICEILREEAAEISSTGIVPICERSIANGFITTKDGETLRRHWHTLKGSSRVAGLARLGEFAYAFEKAFERQVESGYIPIGMAQVCVKSLAKFNAGLDEVINSGKTCPNVQAAFDLIAASENTPELVTTLASTEDQSPVETENIEGLELDLGLEPSAQEKFNDSGQGGIHPDVVREFETECPIIIETLLKEMAKVHIKGVDFELIRSAHSLAGIARIIEYPALEATASAMEQWAAYNYNAGLMPSAKSAEIATALALQIREISTKFRQRHHVSADLTLALELLTHGSDKEGAESIDLTIAEFGESAAESGHSLGDVDLGDLSPGESIAQDSEVVEVSDSQSANLSATNEISPIDQVDIEDTYIGHSGFTADDFITSTFKPVDPEINSELTVNIVAVTPNIPIAKTIELNPIALADTVTDNEVGFTVDESISDDIDKDILLAVSIEADEILGSMDNLVEEFEPGVTTFEEINRLLHTLKGSVRMAGMLRVGSMLHQMEDATMASITLSTEDARALITKLQRGLDFIRTTLRQVAQGGPSTKDQDGYRSSHVVLRVDSDRLDSVSTLVGQVRITQDRVQRRVVDGFELIEGMKSPLLRLTSIARMISQEAEVQIDAGTRQYSVTQGFDALEMDRFTALQEYTRRLQEAVEDVGAIFLGAEDIYRDISEALRQQVELSDGIQSSVDSISKSSLAAVESRLRATVRQACEYTNKTCLLELSGDVGIERGVIDRLVPAIEHMLRNSVAHGLESPDVRRALGKSPQGLISISSRRDGSLASIVIRDDGMGIAFDKVRAKARELGFANADSATEADLVDILFSAGFSTAGKVSDLAGRGVGLDAVQDTINKLGGRISLQSVSGQGVTFSIAIPLSFGYVSGMLLTSAGAPYIFPSTLVKGVDMVSGAEIAKAHKIPGALVRTADGEFKKLFTISQLCGVESKLGIGSFHQVVIPHSNPDVALMGDHLEYINNLPMKPIESDNPLGVGIIGQVLLSDGRVAVVLNPVEIIKGVQSEGTAEIELQSAFNTPLVLIVDDSTTVRKVSSRLLTKNGYRVETAENGVIALEKVAKTKPDVILMDIEMPVMDGFEATKTLRSDPATKNIPIAIISSRNAEKHRDHAKAIGATTFFGKPYNEISLLEWIESVTGLVQQSET